MVTFSETRSALRAVVGYDDEDMIEAQVSLHDQKKEAFETYLKDIESTMVFPQAKEAYNTLVTDLDGYWDIDAEVLELATSSSDDGYLKAQEIDTGELSPQYDKIYQDLATLMDLNVQKGDASKASLHNMELIFMIVIIAVIVVCIVISIRIGNTMAVDIEKPLTALAERLQISGNHRLESGGGFRGTVCHDTCWIPHAEDWRDRCGFQCKIQHAGSAGKRDKNRGILLFNSSDGRRSCTGSGLGGRLYFPVSDHLSGCI